MPSTVIANITYYPNSSILRITFLSGSIYDYQQVPNEVYEEMKSSGSKGIYLNRNIKKPVQIQEDKIIKYLAYNFVHVKYPILQVFRKVSEKVKPVMPRAK